MAEFRRETWFADVPQPRMRCHIHSLEASCVCKCHPQRTTREGHRQNQGDKLKELAVLVGLVLVVIDFDG
eukprot:5428358-Amphidinium_carterae.1